MINETESKLMQLAEQHPEDEIANEAMAELRKRFDSTYFWCVDCDGLVTTEKNCCRNRKKSDILDEDIIF